MLYQLPYSNLLNIIQLHPRSYKCYLSTKHTVIEAKEKVQREDQSMKLNIDTMSMNPNKMTLSYLQISVLMLNLMPWQAYADQNIDHGCHPTPQRLAKEVKNINFGLFWHCFWSFFLVKCKLNMIGSNRI